MKAYRTFVFDSFLLNESTGEVKLNYSLDDEVHFTETLRFPSTGLKLADCDPAALERALFALHLVAGTSYFKTCCPKNMEIRTGTLNAEQAGFWNAVYENGLAEFFYRNEMNPTGLIHFPLAENDNELQASASNQQPVTSNRKRSRALVPVGGGKDSLVTIELLRELGADVTLLRVGHHPLIREIAKIADLPLLTITRELSPALFTLNQQGALNGHVPITATLSFIAVLTCLLYDFDTVVMSNERSANEGNVMVDNREVNHQWSKGLDFERALQSYLEHSVTSLVRVFSLLRPMSELGIAELFCRYPQYFESFTSCNANWKIAKAREQDSARAGLSCGGSSRWCGMCPKCAFVFAILAAFLSESDLKRIFGKNLFETEALLPTYRQLLGIEGIKPFECVGTPEETIAALAIAHERGILCDTKVMKMAVKETVLPADPHALIEQQLTPSGEHAIPRGFREAVTA